MFKYWFSPEPTSFHEFKKSITDGFVSRSVVNFHVSAAGYRESREKGNFTEIQLSSKKKGGVKAKFRTNNN